MSRILVMGYELPGMTEKALEARSYRSWQFVEPLLDDGHEVCLIASHSEDQLNVPHDLPASLIYHRLNLQARGWMARLNQLSTHFKPNAALAVTFNNCLRATRLQQRLPLWMDIYGDKLAEAQIAEHIRNSSRGRRIMLQYLNIVLRGGDKYSTCSTPQQHALVGQLGMASRLNRHTLGYELVHAILPGAPARRWNQSGSILLRGNLVPKEAFIVLWCGGYNVWTDVETLFKAVSQAMEHDPRIVYVSAGAGVKLAQNDAYERFKQMVAASPHQQRFHLLGWQPFNEIPGLYRQADVGINLDAFHYETVLGTRTRLIEMMHYGLPVITTLGCELSEIIQNHNLGLTFQIGDAATFCDHILNLARDVNLLKRYSEEAQSFTSNHLSFSKTTQPFRNWVNKPGFAPDRNQKASEINYREIEYYLRSLVRGSLWNLWGLERGE